jgi:hypothetical protein
MMKKLMTKENGILLGVGVVAFLGVRYMLNKRNETTSSFVTGGSKPCALPEYQGVTCQEFCEGEGGTYDSGTGSYGGCSGLNNMGAFGGTKRKLSTRSYSMASGDCGCGA